MTDFLTALQAFESGDWRHPERGGSNIPNTHEGTSSGQAQGYNQITTGTWNEFGGNKYAPNAMKATQDQQNEIAMGIPMHRWDPKTLNYLVKQGFTVDPNRTLGDNMALNVPPPPSAYGYASSTQGPNAVPGTTINSVPAPGPMDPSITARGGMSPSVASATAPPQSIASMLGQGNFGGAFGAMGQNSTVTGGLGKLAGALGGGGDSGGKQQAAAPALPPPPNLQDNSASIAQQAPSLLAALIAKQKQVPGFSIGGFNG